MFSRILSGAFYGIDSYPVQVEVDVAPGLPCMEMVGCLSREAGEAKQRIRGSGLRCRPDNRQNSPDRSQFPVQSQFPCKQNAGSLLLSDGQCG